MNEEMQATEVAEDEGARIGAMFVYCLMDDGWKQHIWHAYDSHKLTEVMSDCLTMYVKLRATIASIHVVFFNRDANDSKFYVIVNHQMMRDPLGGLVEFDTWQDAENWVRATLPHPTNMGH